MGDATPVRIGDEATTATVLRPGGMVVIGEQRYSARSGGELIEEGTPVIITGGGNHGFAVKTTVQIADRESLPDFGKVVYADFGSSKRAQAIEEERRMQEWLDARRRWTKRMGLCTGGIFAALGVALLWNSVFAALPLTEAVGVACGLIAAGTVIGFLLLRATDGFLRDIDFVLYRFSWPSLCLAFGGFLAGVVWALPGSGVAPGLLWGAAGGLLFGLPLPVITAILVVGSPSDGGAARVAEGSSK